MTCAPPAGLTPALSSAAVIVFIAPVMVSKAESQVALPLIETMSFGVSSTSAAKASLAGGAGVEVAGGVSGVAGAAGAVAGGVWARAGLASIKTANAPPRNERLIFLS